MTSVIQPVRSAIGATVVVWLAGCAVGPDDRGPPKIETAEWIGSLAGIDEPVPQQWWTGFDDPALDALVAAALERNHDVRLARQRIVTARARRAAAAGGYRPGVGTSGAVTRSRRSDNGVFPADRIPGLQSYQTLYEAGFDARWELDLFGQTRRRVEAATARYLASVEQAAAAGVAVVAEVARTYYELRGAQAERSARQASVDAAHRTLELVRRRFEVGEVSRAAVRQAEADYRIERAALPELDAGADQAALALGLLTGELPEARIALASNAEPLPALADVPVGTRAELLRRRPDIRVAERRLAAATAEIGVARGELFPKLALNASGGFSALSASDLFESGSRRWSLGPILSWRIFDGGRIRAEIDAAESETRAAAIEYEQAVLASLTEVEQSLARYRGSRRTLARQREAVEANRASRDLARSRYDAGAISLLDFLEIQRRLFDAEARQARVHAQAARDMVAVYKALGGGWRPGAEPPAVARGDAANTPSDRRFGFRQRPGS